MSVTDSPPKPKPQLHQDVNNIEMYDLTQAAKLLNISDRTMYSCIREGLIEFTMLHRRTMISKQQLLDFVNRSRRRYEKIPQKPE
jgi:excisionase family DNA binding protein